MRKRRLPSPAMFVALLALFVALGGTGYAATQLAANSVGTAQLKRGAVTKEKIAKKTRAALKGARGPAGPAGPAGATGPAGPAGPAGAAGLPATRLFGAFDANGENAPKLLRGVGVTRTSRYIRGGYRIWFNRSVASCVPLATLSAPTGETRNGEISATLSTVSPNVVYVATILSNGLETTDYFDFNLAVFCP